MRRDVGAERRVAVKTTSALGLNALAAQHEQLQTKGRFKVCAGALQTEVDS